MEIALSHVALLVSSVVESAKVLNSHGIESEPPETFASEGTKEIYVGTYAKQSGLLLLLEAISAGPYQRTLKKRGPSLHHIAIDVLNSVEFVERAQALGWQLHPKSPGWLFKKGIPIFIEVQEKKALSKKPLKVSRLELPIMIEDLLLFNGIGLGDIVGRKEEVGLIVDGQKITFAQIERGQV